MIKGGEFLIKEQESKDIFMPEEFTEEQKMMASATTEFVKKELDPNRKRFEKKDYKLTEDCMKKAGDLGLLGISIPVKYGGMGMPFNTSVLICDKISGANGSFSTAFGAHTGIGTLPILLYGDDAQRKKYLPKLSTGEWMGCYCLTEPGAGSDANSGKTKAVLTKDGKNYLITGQKMWISNAGFADVFIVFGRIEDDKNITGFILEKGMDGFIIGAKEDKLGIRGSDTHTLLFNDVKVPKENRIGEDGFGFKFAMKVLSGGRIGIASQALGIAAGAFELSLAYSKERKAFGKEIYKHQSISFKLADMATDIEAARLLVYKSAIDKDNGKSYDQSSAMAKLYASKVAMKHTVEAVQIHGGYGFVKEYHVERLMRDAKITQIYEGTSEIQKIVISRNILKD